MRGEILDIVALPNSALLVRTDFTLFEVDEREARAQVSEAGLPLANVSGVVAPPRGVTGHRTRPASARWPPVPLAVESGDLIESGRPD